MNKNKILQRVEYLKQTVIENSMLFTWRYRQQALWIKEQTKLEGCSYDNQE